MTSEKIYYKHFTLPQDSDMQLHSSIINLAHKCKTYDKTSPFSEETLLHTKHTKQTNTTNTTNIIHITTAHKSTDFHPDKNSSPTYISTKHKSANNIIDNSLIGAAILVSNKKTNSSTLEMCINPEFRENKIGTLLLKFLKQDISAKNIPLYKIRAFSPNNNPAAADLAKKYNFFPTRNIWQMALQINKYDLYKKIAPPQDSNIFFRNFVPSSKENLGDEQSWVISNAEIFKDHPEQGKISITDLEKRISETWFDPKGFFLATTSIDAKKKISTQKEHSNKTKYTNNSDLQKNNIIGFAWTKIVTENSTLIGEIYVLGVSQKIQKNGLGKYLAHLALQYLINKKVTQIILYVDESNHKAIKLYTQLGFTKTISNTMFTQKTPKNLENPAHLKGSKDQP